MHAKNIPVKINFLSHLSQRAGLSQLENGLGVRRVKIANNQNDETWVNLAPTLNVGLTGLKL